MTLRRAPLALAVPILATASAAASPAAGLDVEDEEFAFEPARIESEAGETATVTIKPEAPGTYDVECTVPGYARTGMNGELVVTAPAPNSQRP
ncbi:MAG: hypothetical protein GVY33_06070 [Alphaproteobacteria bacterium]|jgi:uncharacterized cupredoxin-like copper-binding protein|nr:hypothetical protein [Alphaproteobacteria bacterium]